MNDGTAKLPAWYHRSGTAWRTKRLKITVNGVARNLTGAYARARFCNRVGVMVLDWMSDDHPDADDRNGVITIVPADNEIWLAGPESGSLTADPAVLHGDIKIWFAAGASPVVYLDGSLTITEGPTP